MPRYEISSGITSQSLGVYEAEDEQGALDAMARDAGYQDYADATRQVGDGDLIVEEIVSQ